MITKYREKDETRPNTRSEILWDLRFSRRLKLSKALDIWSTTARTVPGLLRTMAIISATTVQNSAAD